MAASKSPTPACFIFATRSRGSPLSFAVFHSSSIKAAICIAARWNAPCILRHEYQRLDDKQLWEIATVHLPQLQPIVAQMLTELDA
jgi:hypothetical protein